MMSYINETDFVVDNKKLVYPEIITDGLQLYYDAKGKRDTDYHRDTMLDMSGNKNHGKLNNFAYEKSSGYKDGLVFDYIDDKLVRPALNLQPDDFTFMLNGNIISFSPDGTVKRVQDGEVIESKGFNLIQNGDFVDGLSNWTQSNLVQKINDKSLESSGTGTSSYNHATQSNKNLTAEEGEKLYLSSKVKAYQPPVNIRLELRSTSLVQADFLSDVKENTWYQMSGIAESVGLYVGSYLRILANYEDNESAKNSTLAIKEVIAINLTKTFGAGNEPTKEQMDEIIDRFGFIPNAQDLIDRIEYKGNDLGDMENIIDGLYKTEVLSGEEVYTDKADDAVVHVEVDGKSYQHAGSGKNLFYPVNLSTKQTYITGLKPNTKYTMSTNTPLPGVHNLYFSTLSMGVDDKSRGGYYTATTDENGSVWYQIYPNRPYTEDLINQKYWIQLEEGSVATEYEPPAPTPDYPIEIHSLNDFDVVSSKAINMFNSKDFIKNGVDNGLPETNTTLIEVDGYYGFQHRLISFAENYFNYLEGQFEENIGYTFSFKYDFTGNNELSTSGMRISYTTGVSDFTTFRGLSDSGEMSIKTDPKRTVKNISVRGWAHGGSFKVWKISLIKTSDFKEFVPHAKDIAENSNHLLIDKINLLLDEPLRSVEDVKDRLFRDSDGLWKVERNVGEYKVTGLEAWGLNANWSDSTKNTFEINAKDFISHNPLKPRFKKVTSNYFTGFRSSNPPINHFRIQENASGNYFTVSLSSEFIAKEGVAWRNWLKEKYAEGNPFTVLYEKDSNFETLPQSLQDKLNNLRSFEDSNYVYTVLPNEDNYISENLKPTLHAKFLYNNWYKEDRVINNLMIYNRALTNEEMLQNYKTVKRRWGM